MSPPIRLWIRRCRHSKLGLKSCFGNPILSACIPRSPRRRAGMIDAAAFAQMKPNAVLVNTARGPVVDQQALYHALKEQRIFAAALDVTDPEPLPVDSPLLELDNLIIAPHIASATFQSRDNMALYGGAKPDRRAEG